MPTTFIDISKNSDVGRGVIRFLGMAREAAIGINSQIAIIGTMLDGDGTDASHFQVLVTKGHYPDTTAAKASYDALVTLSDEYEGLTDALMATCARHGI